MSRLVLLRHAHSSANAKGILSGRNEGVALSKQGFAQAEELISRLDGVSFSAIRTSPMQRCLETIDPWLTHQGEKVRKKVVIEPNLVEVDFGSWTGKKLSHLSAKREWKTVQSTPHLMKFPEGESLKQLQNRSMKVVRAISELPGNQPKLLVTHADVIKSILSGLLHSGLRDFQKFVVNPASITIIEFSKNNARIISVNNSDSHLKELLT
jgi:probable phosphomutase (TIGR03848 family)